MRALSSSVAEASSAAQAEPLVPAVRVEAGASEPATERSVRASRAERRAAARGRDVPGVTRTVPLPGRGKNVVHDRSRYAIRRRG